MDFLGGKKKEERERERQRERKREREREREWQTFMEGFSFIDTLLALRKNVLVGKIVNWCFEPSQPLGSISGLKETFIKRYIVERTNEER